MEENNETVDENSEQVDRATSTGVSRRSIIKAGAWGVPVIAAASAAPARASSTSYTAEILGYSNTISEIPSEFRFDYLAVVPSTVNWAAVTVSYYWKPVNQGNTETLGNGGQVMNIRSSVGQNFGIVATQSLPGGMQRIWVEMRGDSNVDYGSTSQPAQPNGDFQPVFRWPDGSTTLLSAPVIDPTLMPVAGTAPGRPGGWNAWDQRPDPDYPSGNQQSGWGVPTTTGQVRFSQFVMAAGSRRTVVQGGDRSPQLYYQFVNVDTGQKWTNADPVSGTPELIDVRGGTFAVPSDTTPTRIIQSGTRDASNNQSNNDTEGPRLSRALGKAYDDTFTLPAPGYWKLLVWPQAANSGLNLPAPGSPATLPTGVSWDPASEPGHQIGSVFYFPTASGISFNPGLTEIAP